jgi:hypothetical protein
MALEEKRHQEIYSTVENGIRGPRFRARFRDCFPASGCALARYASRRLARSILQLRHSLARGSPCPAAVLKSKSETPTRVSGEGKRCAAL